MLQLSKTIFYTLIFITFFFQQTFTQVPFNNEMRVFVVEENVVSGNFALIEQVVSLSNNAVATQMLNPNLGMPVNAIGFRSTDRLLYGLNPNTSELIRIDATGQLEVLTILNLDINLSYLAGDVTPNGRFLTIIGSEDGIDVEIVRIDLASPTFVTQTSSFSGNTFISDIAFAPLSDEAFGFDQLTNALVRINPTTFNAVVLNPLPPNRGVFSVYYDAFETLFGVGTAVGGVTNAIYSFDKNNGDEELITTGQPFVAADAASCPYAVQINYASDPDVSFPCTELTFVYDVANGSNQTISNAQIEHIMPPGFSFISLDQNDLTGTLDVTAPLDVFRLNNVIIPMGANQIVVTAEIGDIAQGDYNSQANVNNLPNSFIEFVPSNNPNTAAEPDSTEIEVIRFEEDSLFFSNLVCEGDVLVLDASEYGGSITWNNGITDVEQTVTEQGLYFFESSTNCESIVVSFNVTFATCPFTISLGLAVSPKEMLPCSEAIFTYIIGNDSGGERPNVQIEDILPPGIKVLEVLSNPYGGTLQNSADSSVLLITGMNIPLGEDSIKVLMQIGNIPPTIFQNIARLGNLPQEIGMFRISDDPCTQPVDSTRFEVIGVESDSLFLEENICEGQSLLLDATSFGLNHLWDNGSMEPILEVFEPGQYTLQVFDGCEPTFVFYDVLPAPPLSVNFSDSITTIRQGDELLLDPIIINEGSTLSTNWQSDVNGLLECEDCLTLNVQPFSTEIYQMNIDNGICQDSAVINVMVDESRRVFAPNIFSPNGDGFNEIFYIQSPDFGILKSLSIFNRWGGLIYETKAAVLNSTQNGWGTSPIDVQTGVYLWRAEIEFIDGSIDYFYGDVAIVR